MKEMRLWKRLFSPRLEQDKVRKNSIFMIAVCLGLISLLMVWREGIASGGSRTGWIDLINIAALFLSGAIIYYGGGYGLWPFLKRLPERSVIFDQRACQVLEVYEMGGTIWIWDYRYLKSRQRWHAIALRVFPALDKEIIQPISARDGSIQFDIKLRCRYGRLERASAQAIIEAWPDLRLAVPEGVLKDIMAFCLATDNHPGRLSPDFYKELRTFLDSLFENTILIILDVDLKRFGRDLLAFPPSGAENGNGATAAAH